MPLDRMIYCFNLLLLFLFSISCRGQSKTLDYYVEQALNNSPLIKDLNSQILSTQLDSLRIRAGLKPQLTVSSAGLYAPVIHGYGYSTAISNGQSLNGLLTLSKAFVGSGYLHAQFAALGIQNDSLRNSIKLSEQDLRRTITGQYITAYGSLQQQRFSQEVVDLLRNEEEVLKRLTRSNVYRQTDYLTFLVTLKQAQLQLSQSQLQYKTDFALLNYLSGVADSTMSEIVKPELQKELTLTNQNASIFFKQYQLDSLRLNNSRKLIDYSYRPRLSLYADGGYNSDLTAQYYKNFGSCVGFTVSMPLYDGGQRKLLYKKIALERETSRSYRAFFHKQYTQQIIQLNQQISGYEKLIAEINEPAK